MELGQISSFDLVRDLDTKNLLQKQQNQWLKDNQPSYGDVYAFVAKACVAFGLFMVLAVVAISLLTQNFGLMGAIIPTVFIAFLLFSIVEPDTITKEYKQTLAFRMISLSP